jgi:chromosome segregation ATPase
MDANDMRSDGDAPRDVAARASGVRVDGPHRPASSRQDASRLGEKAAARGAASEAARATEEKPAEVGAGEAFPRGATSLTLHAVELAERLQQHQRDVDRREARLNAQEAEFESRLRAARLWIGQRETELQEQQRELARREATHREHEARAAAMLASAADVEARQRDAVAREQRCSRLQVELEVGVTEQRTRLDALELETAACRARQEELAAERAACEQRQRQLDQREATLYAEQERLASDRVALDRHARQWSERDAELTAREVALRKWECELREQAGAVEFERSEVHRKKALQEDNLAELAAQDRRLRFRQQEIETALRRFERLGIVEDRLQEIENAAEQLAARNAYIDHAESLLGEQQREFHQQREQLHAQRREFDEAAARERREWTADQTQRKADLDQRAGQLQRREAALDQREAALERLAEQLRDAQRETLEMRLATEETWLQLQGALAPATLTRSVAHVRTRLAEHFEQAAEDVRRRRADLESLRGDLAEQLEHVEQRQLRLEQWTEAQQRDIEAQASRLVERESALEAQQQELERSAAAWRRERDEQRAELRNLLGQLRQTPRAAAA